MRSATRYSGYSFETLESPFLDEELAPRVGDLEVHAAGRYDPSTAAREARRDLDPGAAEEEILGKDDRTRVTDTLRIPNRWICAIDVMSENPKWGSLGETKYIAKSRATGTLIGSRYLLTAAHVFGSDAKKAAAVVKEHTVSPARNGNNSRNPFGKIKSTAVHTSQPYFVRRRVQQGGKTIEIPIRQTDDYALVILEKDLESSTHSKMKGALGYWGQDPAVAVLRRLDPSAIQSKEVAVIGYPGDTCGTSKLSGSKADKERRIDDCWRRRNDDWASTQWRDVGTLDVDAHSTTVFHTADTYEGQSGSPICLSIDRVLHLVAVHTASDNAQRNQGVRVTRRMLRELCEWINTDAGSGAATIQNDTLILQSGGGQAAAKELGQEPDDEFDVTGEQPLQEQLDPSAVPTGLTQADLEREGFDSADLHYEGTFTMQPREYLAYEAPDDSEQLDLEAATGGEPPADEASEQMAHGEAEPNEY